MRVREGKEKKEIREAGREKHKVVRDGAGRGEDID